MNRKLFFLLEKLKITPHERITITVLMILLLILSLLNLLLEPGTAADAEHYEAIQEEFNRRTEQIDRREEELMSRYNPEPLQVKASDTVSDTNTAQNETEQTAADMQPKRDTTSINVNTATRQKLQTLPGIGPVYAERIVAYRDSTGSFKTVDELLKIKGIGAKRLEKLKPLVAL